MVETALKSAKSAGADTDIINLGSVNIEPCVACDICKAMGECGIEDDIKEILEIMMESDEMIIGSPVYFGSVTSQLKILIDRSRPLEDHSDLKIKFVERLLLQVQEMEDRKVQSQLSMILF